jgi:hypothetical protein
MQFHEQKLKMVRKVITISEFSIASDYNKRIIFCFDKSGRDIVKVITLSE